MDSGVYLVTPFESESIKFIKVVACLLVWLRDEVFLEGFNKSLNLAFLLWATYAGKYNIKTIVVCKRSKLRN